MPMKAAIPFYRTNNNTSVPPETLTKEAKIAGRGGMIPTYPLEMVTMRGCLEGTTKVMNQHLSAGEGGTILGAAIPGQPTRAQPHEGGRKRLSPSLHGCSGTANGIPVHDRGIILPSLDEIQDAVD